MKTLQILTFGFCLLCACRPSKESVVAEETMQTRREAMVNAQLKRRDIHDPAVLKAMATVERHQFVPPESAVAAYEDRPLPIGFGQTISQPYIVAYMTQALRPKANHRALEIGTGSGYQAAVLAKLVKAVCTIEIVTPLCEKTQKLLKQRKYDNVMTRCGDGYKGWKEHAPALKQSLKR